MLLGAAWNNHKHTAQGKYEPPSEHAAKPLKGVPEPRVAPIPRGKPPPREPEPDRKEWREEQNLRAQREMADYTLATAVAAFIGVAVTTIGIWFVKLTLDATRDAVKEASKGTEAAERAVELTRQAHITEQRPWIAVRAVKGGEGVLAKDLIQGFLWVRYTNFGKTPAIDVKTHSQCYFRQTSSDEIISHFLPQLTIMTANNPGQTLIPNEWFEMGSPVLTVGEDILAKEASVHRDRILMKLAVGATYKSVLSDQTYHSVRTYFVTIHQVAEGKVQAESIRFVEMEGAGHFT